MCPKIMPMGKFYTDSSYHQVWNFCAMFRTLGTNGRKKRSTQHQSDKHVWLSQGYNILSMFESLTVALQVRCTSCQETSDKWQVVSSAEVTSLPGSRGEAHYVAKCKLCSKTNSLSEWMWDSILQFLTYTVAEETKPVLRL